MTISVLDRVTDRMRILRAQILTPSHRGLDPVTRGFQPWAEGPSIVTSVGSAFLEGYELACRAKSPQETLAELTKLAPKWRGFAAEGAGMAVTLRSRLEPWSRGALADFLERGSAHNYLIHVGVGWAMARLPRPLWPDLASLDRSLVPLVLDGYGFHEVFFHTRRVLTANDAQFPLDDWPGGHANAQQHLAQGIGRGLWFVAGGSETVLGRTIDSFRVELHGSLWAGVGLAMTYAGGRTADGMASVVRQAGKHRAWLRQGSAFAAEARRRSGTVTPHTELAVEVICERDLADVLRIVAESQPLVPSSGPGHWLSYQEWRTNLAGALDNV